MKVYVVEQSSGSFDDYYSSVEAVCLTMDKALEIKAELDTKCVSLDAAWEIVPENIYYNWPEIDSDSDIEEEDNFIQEYQGFTSDQAVQCTEIINQAYQNFHPATITEFEVVQ